MLNFLKYVKNFVTNFRLIFIKSHKLSIILNYHRIGNVDPQNPFHRLHTVSFTTFKFQVRMCLLIGKFVSLDQITNSNLHSRLNFCITFDDLSYSCHEALLWLNKQKIPFAVCPCKQITEESLSWRDKVYYIEKFISNKDALDAVRKKFPTSKFQSNDSFYSLSKSSEFDQGDMIKDVVNVLFKSVQTGKKKLENKKNYFNSIDLIRLKNKIENLEIVNHSVSHANLTHFDIAQLNNEISECDEFLRDLFDETPSYFAVPFGKFDSRLAIGLCEVARVHQKKAILWVSNRFNLDIGATPNKTKQLSRFHTATSVLGLFKQILGSFLLPHFVKHVSQLKSTYLNEFNIIANPETIKVLAFEDISRPTKDYSGDVTYLNDIYIKNPFLSGGAHTIVEIQNNRVMAIGQNLPLPFSDIEDNVVINFFGNWRSVAGSSKMGAAAILGKALKEHDLTLSYRPSKIIEPSFVRMGWQSLYLKKYISTLCNKNAQFNCPDLVITNNVEELPSLEQFNCKKTDIIQLELSKKLIQWRVQSYNLAIPIYFFWGGGNGEKALVIGQYKNSELLFLDQRFSSPSVLMRIVEKIIEWARFRDFKRISAETSCSLTQKVLSESMPNAKIQPGICYLKSRGSFRKLKKKKIIITPLSSDILLR